MAAPYLALKVRLRDADGLQLLLCHLCAVGSRPPPAPWLPRDGSHLELPLVLLLLLLLVLLEAALHGLKRHKERLAKQRLATSF